MKIQTRFSDKFLNEKEKAYFLKKRKEFKLKQRDIATIFGLDISSIRLTDSKEQYPRYYMMFIENIELKQKIEQLELRTKDNNNFLDRLIEDIISFKNANN